MSNSAQSPGNMAPATTRSTATGQVCDRCRAKKVKCNGALPACAACQAAETTCKFSATLQRKTRIRGFPTAKDDISQLRSENSELRQQLMTEKETNQQLRREIERLTADSRQRKLPRTGQRPAAPQSPYGASSENSGLDRSSLVMKHMGRLVLDRAQVGRFAGSTTGVHFISSVEQKCRSLFPGLLPLPEGCFRLHLLQAASTVPDPPFVIGTLAQAFPNSDLQAVLKFPLIYYMRQIDEFNDIWGSLCPVMPRNVFERRTGGVLDAAATGLDLPESEYASLQTILLVLVLNMLHHQEDDTTSDIGDLLNVICRLHVGVVARGDQWSLQALILFSLYVQVTGQTGWLVQVNGMMVRLAQSLGMHRHARRFKFPQEEVEFRKRMWWWVYAFDKCASAVHGLPKLIHDNDVDNDLPEDCDLRDIQAGELVYPLPGEPTPVSLYVHYIQLAKIMSSVLDQLYTTTDRRRGAEKMARLERDLRVWNHAVNSHPHVMAFEIGERVGRNTKQSDVEEGYPIVTLLKLMANLTIVYIHRPALSFDPATPQFAQSLRTCVVASITLIDSFAELDLRLQPLCSLPLGPSVVFQSCLMLLYYHCSSMEDDSERAIRWPEITSKVSDMIRLFDTTLSGSQNNGAYAQDIAQAAAVLKNLLTMSNEALVPRSSFEGFYPQGNPQQERPTEIEFLEHSSTDDFWSYNALDSLNNLDILDFLMQQSSPYPSLS